MSPSFLPAITAGWLPEPTSYILTAILAGPIVNADLLVVLHVPSFTAFIISRGVQPWANEKAVQHASRPHRTPNV